MWFSEETNLLPCSCRLFEKYNQRNVSNPNTNPFSTCPPLSPKQTVQIISLSCKSPTVDLSCLPLKTGKLFNNSVVLFWYVPSAEGCRTSVILIDLLRKISIRDLFNYPYMGICGIHNTILINWPKYCLAAAHSKSLYC